MPRKPGLVTVAARGDYRASLEALRDRLAAEVERSEGAAGAALSKQRADVLTVLDGMTEPEVSKVVVFDRGMLAAALRVDWKAYEQQLEDLPYDPLHD